MTSLTVVILTFNESRHLARCLASIQSFAADVLVIDSYSTDSTLEIARSFGARVLQNKFRHQAQQFQWGLEQGGITTAWVMRLDADEIVEPDLGAEIQRRLPTLGPDIAGVNLKRKHIFMGRWIRHGGRYPLLLLRIWRHGQGRIENRWMDEHVLVWGGRTVTFDGAFADHNLNDLTAFIEKHNRYATREAIDVLSRKYGLSTSHDDLTRASSSTQTALKRWIKVTIYNRLPFPTAAGLYFLYRWLFQRGFLDGIEGAIYHVLQGFWYRFLVGAKIVEFERVLARLDGKEAIGRALSQLTGYDLASPVEAGRATAGPSTDRRT